MQPTKREKEVLNELCNGLTVKEIASKLSISHHTINSHKQSLCLKLDARNVAHLVAKAVRSGMITA